MGLRREFQQGCEYWVAQLGQGRLSKERLDLIQIDLRAMPVGSILVIDFAGVDFISSSGLGSLLKLLRLALSKKTLIVIVGLQQKIFALFTLTKMDRLFPIYQDIDGWLDKQRSLTIR